MIWNVDDVILSYLFQLVGLVLGACVEITIRIILEDHPLFYLACGLFTMTTLYGITVIKSVD